MKFEFVIHKAMTYSWVQAIKLRVKIILIFWYNVAFVSLGKLWCEFSRLRTSILTQIRYTGRYDTQIKKSFKKTSFSARIITHVAPLSVSYTRYLVSDLNFYNKCILILIRYSHTVHIHLIHNLKACLILKFLNT